MRGQRTLWRRYPLGGAARVATGALFVLAGLVACDAETRSTVSAAQDDNALRVVSTFSILGCLVQRVGGDRIDHTVLVGRHSDPHTFEPAPHQARSIAEADLIFEIGLGFETWLDGLHEATHARGRRLAVAAGFEPLEGSRHTARHDHGHGHAAGARPDADRRSHGARNRSGRAPIDPHVWHDPLLAARMVERICEALVEADPEGEALYRANERQFLVELDALDRWIREQLDPLPAGRRKLVTSHDTFGYFATRYDLEVLGAALASLTTETADPAASEMVELIRRIRAAGVPAIFAENTHNPRILRQVAREAEVDLVPMLYTDALGDMDGEGGDYLGMMRFNVRTIVEALQR